MSTGYTKDHEWIRVDGDTATLGITSYAAEQLGDVVFVELPAVGKSLAKGDVAAAVESVKVASDVFSPLSGEVVETNGALEESPQTVNEAPEADGWFLRLKVSDQSEVDGLMSESDYRGYIATLE